MGATGELCLKNDRYPRRCFHDGERVNRPMTLMSSFRNVMTLATLAAGIAAAGQTQTPATDQAPAPAAAAPAATPDATPKPWRIAKFDVSGFADGFYTNNQNHPTESANGKMNDLYNFNQDANQPALSAVKLTLNHDPAPVGAHFDFIYGRTNKLINAPNQLDWVEQAFISIKPPKAKGFEADLGKFVTAMGAETIEAKDNWNYSRSLLFAWAIPYWHFGLRSTMPVSKTDTVGLELVNGWNNITHNTGGVTAMLMNTYVQPKYTWSLNFCTGPNNTPGQDAYRNTLDTTVLLTPSSKFNAYVNFDYGQNHNKLTHGAGDTTHAPWYGIAVAAHQQLTPRFAVAGRTEYFKDDKGYATGTAQSLKEFTGTVEYHWKVGLISRAEYRHDWSDQASFHRNATDMTKDQQTFTIGMIAIIAPSR